MIAYLLILAEIPALLCGVFLSAWAGAPQSMLLQQLALATLGAVAAMLTIRLQRRQTKSTSALWWLCGLAILLWLPDPLQPVPFVEGIFSIALHYFVWVFGLAVFSAAIPIMAMAWVAYRIRSQGVLAVGLYFLTLYLLSPLEVTPVPLLGLGAGPLLGYFIVASQITFRSGDVDG